MPIKASWMSFSIQIFSLMKETKVFTRFS